MTKPPASRRHLPTSPFNKPVAPPVKVFTVGDRVSHDRHGLGRVVGVEDGIATLVDFGGPNEIRVTSPYSGMDKL